MDGIVALVTGGNSGIGLATAHRFAAEGARVFMTGRSQEELDRAVAAVGHGAVGVRGDVSDLADLDRLYGEIRERAGRLDVLFANAGVAETAPLGRITEAHFDRLFAINVKGLLFTVQKALPLMPDGASIVLNGSIAGVKGMPGFSVYSATKAAVRSLARGWAMDLKDRRIRVNVVSPGPIDTPGVDGLAAAGSVDPAAFRSGLVAGVPLGRLGDPDEVARAVVFLAGEDSRFVTGAELFVDGGMAQV